jgi:hypothetical protein
MAALENFQNAIQNWARDQVNLIVGGMPVIWENPNAPRPSFPYIGLLIVSFEKVGLDDVSRPDENGIAKLIANYLINLTVNCYYEGNSQAIDGLKILDFLRLSLGKQEVMEHFYINKIGIIKEMTSILNTTTVFATGYEQRISMDLQFGATTYLESEEGLIEKVEGKGTFDHCGEIIEQTYST